MKLSFIAVAALACSAPAWAQAQTETATVYQSMSPAELKSIVKGTGLGETITDGTRAFWIRMSNGFEFRVESTVCDTPDACFGIAITSRWPLTPEQLASARDALFANTTGPSWVLNRYSQDGKLVLQRYLILDGGITRANIEYELRQFVRGVWQTASFLTKESGIPLSLPPG